MHLPAGPRQVPIPDLSGVGLSQEAVEAARVGKLQEIMKSISRVYDSAVRVSHKCVCHSLYAY